MLLRDYSNSDVFSPYDIVVGPTFVGISHVTTFEMYTFMSNI